MQLRELALAPSRWNVGTGITAIVIQCYFPRRIVTEEDPARCRWRPAGVSTTRRIRLRPAQISYQSSYLDATTVVAPLLLVSQRMANAAIIGVRMMNRCIWYLTVSRHRWPGSEMYPGAPGHGDAGQKLRIVCRQRCRPVDRRGSMSRRCMLHPQLHA